MKGLPVKKQIHGRLLVPWLAVLVPAFVIGLASPALGQSDFTFYARVTGEASVGTFGGYDYDEEFSDDKPFNTVTGFPPIQANAPDGSEHASMIIGDITAGASITPTRAVPPSVKGKLFAIASLATAGPAENPNVAIAGGDMDVRMGVRLTPSVRFQNVTRNLGHSLRAVFKLYVDATTDGDCPSPSPDSTVFFSNVSYDLKVNDTEISGFANTGLENFQVLQKNDGYLRKMKRGHLKFTAFIREDQNFDLSMEMFLWVIAHINGATGITGTSFATADFSSTMVWEGVDEVYDLDAGEYIPVENFDMLDATNYNWSRHLGPPVIIDEPQSQTAYLGNSGTTFKVLAAGTGPLAYQWRFEGTNIDGATDGSYTRTNTQLADAGGYSVVITNIEGSVTSAVASLTVTSLVVSTWSGLGADGRIGTAENWDNPVAPGSARIWLFQGQTQTAPVINNAFGTTVIIFSNNVTPTPFVVGGNAIRTLPLGSYVQSDAPVTCQINGQKLTLRLADNASGNQTDFRVMGAGNLTVSATIIDSTGTDSTLVKSGPSLLSLAGTTNNSYSGGTIIKQGVLRMDKATAGTIAIPGNVTVNSGGILRNNKSEQIKDTGAIVTLMSGGRYEVQSLTETVEAMESDAANAGAVISLGSNGVLRLQPTAAGLYNLGAGVSGFYGEIQQAGGTSNGSLTMQGAGTLFLNGTNTYSGSTTISAGTLALGTNASIASSTHISVAAGARLNVSAVFGGFTLGANQTLTGNGSVKGNVTANGAVSPGASIGTLSFSNALILAGVTTMEIDRSALPQNADMISATGLTYGGALIVTNVGVASPALADHFQLFSGSSYSGSFSSITLPLLSSGLIWTNKLGVDGSIEVIAPSAATLSLPAYLVNGDFQFSVTGSAGVNYVIQASTNLTEGNWVSLFTNTVPFNFTDTSASNSMQRFYRAVHLP